MDPYMGISFREGVAQPTRQIDQGFEVKPATIRDVGILCLPWSLYINGIIRWPQITWFSLELFHPEIFVELWAPTSNW